jgi:hypothetical protein
MVLKVNPPLPGKVRNINVFCNPSEGRGFLSFYPSFEIGENRFALTPEIYNLDSVKCDSLDTGELYVRSAGYVPDSKNPDAIPF